jgi:hypothetical protein
MPLGVAASRLLPHTSAQTTHTFPFRTAHVEETRTTCLSLGRTEDPDLGPIESPSNRWLGRSENADRSELPCQNACGTVLHGPARARLQVDIHSAGGLLVNSLYRTVVPPTLRCVKETEVAIAADRRRVMTSKSDFTAEEWRLILEAPPSAGMIVVTAQRGGSFRETIAMAKAYAEARQEHGHSEILDEIAAAKPERDHTHYHSPEELKQHGLQHLHESVVLLESKATPAEVDEYRRFIITLSHKVAVAHREHGQEISASEQTAIDDITEALNTAVA